MPELPDVTIYTEALQRLIVDKRLVRTQLRSPFVVRTFDPGLTEIHDKQVTGISRLGKRIVWHLEDDLFLVFHLMIAGRFHQRKPGSRPVSKRDLCAFHFDHVTLMLTEASSKHRAGLWVVRGIEQLSEHDPGGIDRLAREYWQETSAVERHTLG